MRESNQCDSKFSWQTDLRKYEEVKYPCNQCNLKFSQPGHLKAHQMSVHKGIKYSCNQCDL